jgi:histidinol-phosphate aminotransferase
MPALPSRLEASITRRHWLQNAGALATLAAVPARLRAEPLARLSLNENAFGPSPRALEAIQRGLRGLERYTTDDDASALTRQIAELEHVAEEQVLLGEVLEPLGLQLGLQGGAGGEFVYSEPGYTALVDAAKPVGGVGVAVALDNQLENDLPQLAAKITPRTRAVFVVNPHNPSGTVSDPARLKAFVQEAAKRTLVIVDEAYLEYTDDFSVRTQTAQLRAGANVIVFRTFSKIHGLAALPLGYALAPAALAADLRRRGVGHPRALDRLALRAAAASVRDVEHLARVRELVAAERTRWHRELDALKLRHSAARGNFVFFETPRPQAEIAAGLARAGIDIGRAFPPLTQWTRISIGSPADNRRAQTALRSFLTTSSASESRQL